MLSVSKDEIKRKGFHLFSLIYVFGYWYLPKTAVVYGLVIAIIIVVLFEYLRFKILRLNDFFQK
jgi:uncharacterized membrane protein YraQ (UPF0718 family)